MQIDYPWPDSELSPNARVHHMALARIKADYKRTGWALTCEHLGHARREKICDHLKITFHPPDRRRRDLDNMLASIKALLDGVALALGVDDSTWSLTIKRGHPVADGRVSISFISNIQEGK